MTAPRQRPFGPRAPVVVPPDGDEHPEYTAGWRDGFAAGAAAQPDRELFAFVEVPWSSIRAEDTFQGEDGGMYHVVRSGRMPNAPGAAVDGSEVPGWIVTLVCGTYRDVITLDHDTRVRVLVPVTLADALIVSHAGLPGSRLIATRADPGGLDGEATFEGDQPWRVEIGPLR
jgi:hypothetical protein